MAGEITHIVLADKVFDKFFQDKNRKDFYIGTVFPDIRLLGIAKREETHPSLQDIKLGNIKQEKNSFLAGIKFHSLVDVVEDSFMSLKGLFSPKTDSPLEFLEEELYYNKISNWNEIIDFLNTILPEELSFHVNIQEKDIKKWHKLLQKGFSDKPNNKIRKELAEGAGFSKSFIDRLTESTAEINKDERVVKAIEEFYNNFESILAK